MGANGANVDNVHSGGLVCGISNEGVLGKYAFDLSLNTFERHPQGFVFEGKTIIGFDECVGITKRLAPRFVYSSRLISWDYTIGEDGHPIFIEGNFHYGGISNIHQICNGPIFGNNTKDVLEEVFAKHPLLK